MRNLTAAEAGVLCAKYGVIARPNPSGGWYAEVPSHTKGRSEFGPMHPTYAGAVQAVCEAAGLDMAVALKDCAVAPAPQCPLTPHLWASFADLIDHIEPASSWKPEPFSRMRAAWDALKAENARLIVERDAAMREPPYLLDTIYTDENNSLRAENVLFTHENTALRKALQQNDAARAGLVEQVAQLQAKTARLASERDAAQAALDKAEHERNAALAASTRLQQLQDCGISVSARPCPACGRMTLCLPEGLTCLPCQVLKQRERHQQETARLDREDPRASTIETWCLAHGGCYVECEGEQPTGYRWVAGKEPHGPDDWHPTARAAMDAYEAEQKPKADPECVALLRWWRHCEQFGASVSEWTLQFGASQEMNNAGPSHRLVFRHVAGIWCGSPFHALRGWYDSWLETDEAWLAAEELDRLTNALPRE